MQKVSFLALALAVCFTATASAQIFNEMGDAPSLLPGQAVAAGTTQIVGDNLDGTEDLYSFIWGGGVLTIDTLGSDFDTQLHLFDGLGAGIGENDDSSGLQSEISLDLSSGTYFIGVTGFNSDALDSAGGAIFGFTNTFTDLNGNFIQGPENNPAGILAGWDGGGVTGNYNVNFSDAVSVPEPTSALILVGTAGIALVRRRR